MTLIASLVLYFQMVLKNQWPCNPGSGQHDRIKKYILGAGRPGNWPIGITYFLLYKYIYTFDRIVGHYCSESGAIGISHENLPTTPCKSLQRSGSEEAAEYISNHLISFGFHAIENSENGQMAAAGSRLGTLPRIGTAFPADAAMVHLLLCAIPGRMGWEEEASISQEVRSLACRTTSLDPSKSATI